jgi:hypothetical protein
VRRVETLAGEVFPIWFRQNHGVHFPFPENGEALALGVIFQAGEVNARLFPTGFTSGVDVFQQISTTAYLNDVSGLWQDRLARRDF